MNEHKLTFASLSIIYTPDWCNTLSASSDLADETPPPLPPKVIIDSTGENVSVLWSKIFEAKALLKVHLYLFAPLLQY